MFDAISSFTKRLFGDANDRELKKLQAPPLSMLVLSPALE